MDEGRINRLGALRLLLLLTALLLCRLLILGVVDDDRGDDAREEEDDGDVGSEYNSWNSAAIARGIMPIQ